MSLLIINVGTVPGSRFFLDCVYCGLWKVLIARSLDGCYDDGKEKNGEQEEAESGRKRGAGKSEVQKKARSGKKQSAEENGYGNQEELKC
jgi:hypothetical protein